MFSWTAIAIHWRFSKTLVNFLSKISHRSAQQNQNLMIMLIETWIQWYIFRRRLFQIHFRDTKSCILMGISLKFVPMVPIDKQSSLFHLNQFTDAFVWFQWINTFLLTHWNYVFYIKPSIQFSIRRKSANASDNYTQIEISYWPWILHTDANLEAVLWSLSCYVILAEFCDYRNN